MFCFCIQQSILGCYNKKTFLGSTSIQNFKTKSLSKIKRIQNKNIINFFMKNESMEEEIIWEIDFFSRPVIDENGKKLWELIVVDQKGNFEHIETVPNNLVNSKELKKRIKILLEKTTKKPKVIKFFRSQMFNMINIALSDLDLIVRPSRRTFSLYNKISEREEKIYPEMKGYRPFMRESDFNTSLKKVPQKMPDALRGEKYIFASLSSSELLSMTSSDIPFSGFFPLPINFDKNQQIPGIVIYSERAKSLSGWLDGVELCNVFCDLENKNLIFECGLDIQFLFAKFSETKDSKNSNFEPKFFEKNKKKSQGIHFVAVQSYSEGKEITGIWTLKSQSF
mmetsp:Transcript_6323/g.15274  ORF Transcript_6323/g.15274 Transcript_6323/m.15274 type:complete len:338 (+) Transcript_6323:2-1015(+)